MISAGADVEEIESFTIFDSWGNMIYLNEHFLPNATNEAWDGKRKGVTLNPAVYAYKMVVITTRDGRSYSGNITAENQRQVTLRVVGQDAVVINKSSIQSREVTPVSMMPQGLMSTLKQKEIIDLVTYIRTAGK